MKAIIWLEDYLQTWPSSLLVVSHDRNFLDSVPTDIIFLHSQCLETYRYLMAWMKLLLWLHDAFLYKGATMKTLWEQRMRRWRTNRGNTKLSTNWGPTFKSLLTSSDTMPNEPLSSRVKSKCWRSCKLKIFPIVIKHLVDCLLFRPELKPVEKETEVILRFPEVEPIAPPALQLDEATFSYNSSRVILQGVNLSAGSDSRICIVIEQPLTFLVSQELMQRCF